MAALTAYLTDTVDRFKSSALAALILLYFVRISSVLINVPRNIGELARPDKFYPEYAGWLQFLMLGILFFGYFFSVRKFRPELQYKSALIYPVAFLLLSAINLKLGEKPLLFQLFETRVLFDDFWAILVWDMFFQSPFIFWCLCWYGLVFYLTRKTGREKIIDVFCILPLLQFSSLISNFQVIFDGTLFVLTIFATRYAKGRSPGPFHLVWGLSFGIAVIYLSRFAIVYQSALFASALLFSLVWISGLASIKIFDRAASSDESQPENGHSWFYLLFFGYLFSYGINEIPMGPVIFNFWFLITSLNYAFLTVLQLFAILLLTMIAGIFNRNFEKPVFGFCLSFAVIYYIIDAFVFLKLGQRLDYNAINWVFGLSRLSLFIETAQGMLSWKIILGLFGLPAVFFSLFHFARSRQKAFLTGKNSFSISVFLLISMSSFIGIRLLCMPINVLGDPVQKFLATVPYFDGMFNQIPRLENLKQEFAETGFDIEKGTRRFLESQRKLPDKEPANLILITLESTGTQYLSLFGAKDMTMPNLESIKDRIEIFPFYFSTFPESANAEFSIYSGLMASTFHVFRHKPNHVGKTLIEALKSVGYDCSLYFCIYAGNTGILSFFLPRGADRIYDATSMPGMTRDDGWIWGLKEHFVAERITEAILSKKDSSQPFFIYFRTAFPHAPFDPIDGSEPVFAKNLPPEMNRIERFKDCILYIDRQIFKIVKAVEQAGLTENTYIVIIGDHVTNLGEDGRFGHGWNLEPRLANVPLMIIRPRPGGFKVNLNPGSHIDLMPTALNLVGARSKTPLAIQGTDLLSPQPPDKKIFISSFNHLALIENGHYYWYRRYINNSKVFKMDFFDGRTRFEETRVSESELKQKENSMIKISNLQKQLIMNFDRYADELYGQPYDLKQP